MTKGEEHLLRYYFLDGIFGESDQRKHFIQLINTSMYISLDTSNAMAPFVMDDIRNISQFKKINPTIQSKVIFGIASLMQYLYGLIIPAFSLRFE